LVLNNLEFDHADIFADLAAIETQFHHLVRTMPRTGRIVANAASSALERVIERGCWSELEWFNRREMWSVDVGREDVEAVFSLAGELLGSVDLPLAGSHNRENALAAVAAARHVGVPPSQAIGSLARFKGIKRRLEVRGVQRGVTVYDDFAHHPTAIALTVEGLRRRHPAGRILAVLEPRSNTMKLGVMKAQLPGSLAQADKVFCYTQGLGWDAAQALAPLGESAACHDDLDRLVADVVAQAEEGDHVLVMSNGGFGGVHQRLLTALQSA
jgi:UDP-N-acetylmuramate: L-alanyl-gamma-D-glutamyl-meso-diaminopimelate ligase